ncbi:MAG: 50S ribosomal protein L33 [Pseudomonadales bacterium]|jgi:ribosomal protein L33|nr:50S ribosomal protein L33 [Pseudomonadales bacterium]
MAAKKKGPRQIAGLQCTVCKSFGYITEYNRNNDILKRQSGEKETFPLNKYCKRCQKHTSHKLMKKLK